MKMSNLIVFYGEKEILPIVKKYQNMYQSHIYQIKVKNSQDKGFINRFKITYLNEKIAVERCPFDLLKYDNIIVISTLWFNELPKPLIKFLEQQAGRIKKVSYVLYNNNKKDREQEFQKMDRILNLRRDKSYFVSITKEDIHVRVYQ